MSDGYTEVLLPAGRPKTVTEWSVRKDGAFGSRRVLEPGTEADTRIYLSDERRYEAKGVPSRRPAELVRRSVTVWPDGSKLIRPWSVVEPVAVKEASE